VEAGRRIIGLHREDAVMNIGFYDMLVRNASEASQRARWVFTAAIVISLIQLGPIYNFAFGQLRDYTEKLVFDKTMPYGAPGAAAPNASTPASTPAAAASAPPPAAVSRSVVKITEKTTATPDGCDPCARTERITEKVTETTTDKPAEPAAAAPPGRSVHAAAALSELQKAMVASWVEQQTIEVGLLGIKFHAADASLIGSVAFIIVITWLFYAVRRENHLFGRTLELVAREAPTLRTHVFYALNSTQVFSTLSEDDGPYVSAALQPRAETAGAGTTAPAAAPGAAMPGNSRPASPLAAPKSAFAVRPLAAALTYLPVVTLGCMILTDLASVFVFKAVFRGFDGSLNELHRGKIFEGNGSFFLVVLFEVLALAFVWYLCIRIRRLQLGTQQLLRNVQTLQWQDILPGPDPALKSGPDKG
jgi:hypothetical protein